ncbi:Hypothetical predicted protein [Octopus vulgaris]|uniref:Protein quiver n=1 Tax=Octopus vulgaris TaxID=6645 RepID=A0AA36F0I7_OCTVU|nr:Hypothetical predicted protein [Octopus vulgaris]
MDVSPLFLMLLVLSLIERGLCIKCYNCNSSPFQSGRFCVELPKKSSFEIDCDLFQKNYTRCRKVVQNVDDEVRIIRQCATSDGKIGCESRVGTKNIKMRYCLCDKDRLIWLPQNMISLSHSLYIVLLICIDVTMIFFIAMNSRVRDIGHHDTSGSTKREQKEDKERNTSM